MENARQQIGEALADETEKVSVLQINRQGKSEIEDRVIKELPLTIVLDNQEMATLLCSPGELKYLAVGFLFSEGFITGKEEIDRIIVDEQRSVVRVTSKEGKEIPKDILFKRLITSGCGRGAAFYSGSDITNQAMVESQIKISADGIFSLVNNFQHHSQVYRATGGVHSAALCDTRGILAFSDDLGRHNAIDKILGKCLLEDIATQDRIIVTSGRVSSEILFKMVKRRIPIIISVSAPTNLGVKLATDFGLTLIGFVRGKRMNIYCNPWRVIS